MKLRRSASEFSAEFLMLLTIARRVGLALVVMAVIAAPLSGFYVVRVNETGVLKRFGRITDDRVPPGLHYRLPWPIDEVITISTREIRRWQAGFGADPEQLERHARQFGMLAREESSPFLVSYCITGDKNIIHVKVIAQHRIDDPRAYLVGCKDPEKIVLRCIQSAVLTTLSQADVDSALTTGRTVLQQQILKDVQRQLATLDTGISVISTEIKNTRPPSAVARAFKDVINAREEQRTMLHDAQAYRNQMIPQGEAEASRIVNQARAYKARKVAHASGEARRFEMLAEKYVNDREITRHRLYLDAVGEILPAVEKVIVGSDDGRNIANLKFFTAGEDGGDR